MNTFLMTWSPKGWPHKELKKLIHDVQSGNNIVAWRMRSYKLFRKGDSAVFYKQGAGLKGIFAYGEIISEKSFVDIGDPEYMHKVLVRIDHIVDPLQALFVSESQVKHLLPVNTQASGAVISNKNMIELDAIKSTTPVTNQTTISVDWSREEIEAAIDAYLEMLQFQSNAIKYKKSEVRTKYLSTSLKKRSVPSFEWRMRNISSYLQSIGSPILIGYLPANNTGTTGLAAISEILESRLNLQSYTPTEDISLLDVQVKRLLREGIYYKPKGMLHPQSAILNNQKVYLRDPRVKAWILQNSGGNCEGCLQNAPFISIEGYPFLEVHHMKHLSENGSDRVENTVALCPNCHRRCHLSADKESFKEFLYQKINRLELE